MYSKNYDNFFEDRTVLVTGGAGFIGSHLTQHLVQLGAKVRVLDDFSSGHRTNLDGLDVSVVTGSVLDTNAIAEAVKGCSHVFHEAAFISVPESFENPDTCFEVNIKGTSNVLKMAKNASCQRVIFAASAACYGSSPQLPSLETDPISAESPYAQSKVMGEQLMRDATIDTVSLRYFNVFGKRQDPNSQYAAVVSAFVNAILNNREPILFGDGKQSRDFTNVSNVVHANLLAAAHPSPLCGEVFNVGTGKMLSLIELVEILFDGNQKAIHYQPKRTGDVSHSCANIEKIQTVLGYDTVIDTAESLRLLVNPTRH
jgi:UDP-glucose 4-epimerase